jgi:hypothetical protein
MTKKDYTKLNLMVFGINHDYFGYGSSCKKMKDGKWRSDVDGETFTYTEQELASEWDKVDGELQRDIIECYAFEMLDRAFQLQLKQ